MNKVIDLRSDTVTRPTQGMLAAMAAAEVGDDVWGDDPTVNRLQAVLAERAGFEAALFFPSGTQSNLAALMAHCARGEEYIVGQQAHTYKSEGGGAAVLGSIQPQPLDNEADGSIALDKIEAAIKPNDPHYAMSRLLALENTITGRVLPQSYVKAATDLAHARGLSTHLDGARVFNAAVAQGLSIAEVCKGFDSVSICLSKGLGAPVGSVLVGSKALIARALRHRKMLGGGMRQAGILAAAGLYALDHHVERLADDHANARRLAEGMRGLAGLSVESCDTNIVILNVAVEQVQRLQTKLHAVGIKAAVGPRTRCVTHLDVDSQDIERVIQSVRHALA